MSNNRKLTYSEIHRLSDLWLRDWHNNPKRYEGGNTEQWFNAVVDFLEGRGDEIVPREVRQQEIRVIQLGRSQEYLAALRDVVMADAMPEHNDYDNAVLIMTATPEDRAEALNQVLKTEEKKS